MVEKLKGLCISTRYASIDELVAKMHRYCDETSLFVATRGARDVGRETPFAVELSDGSYALRGWCVVLEVWTTPDNPFRKPGMRLGLSRLTRASQAVFEQLQAARRAAAAAGESAEQGRERRRRRITLRTPRLKVTMPAPRTAAWRASSPAPAEVEAPQPRRPTRRTGAVPAAAVAAVEASASPLTDLSEGALANLIDGRLPDEGRARAEPVAVPGRPSAKGTNLLRSLQPDHSVPLADGTVVLEPEGEPTARLRRKGAPAASWAPPPEVSSPMPPPPRASQPLALAPVIEPPPARLPRAPRSAAASAIRWSIALAALLVLLGAAAAVGLAY